MNPLAAVIAQVESGGFPYALRFEDGLYKQLPPGLSANPALLAAQAANHCSAITAHMIYCTSFGLFQIMGFNLYGFLGWKLSTTMFCYDTSAQLNAFADFCTHNGVNPATFDFHDDAALEHFARVYNGPGDIANYTAKMKAAFAAQAHA